MSLTAPPGPGGDIYLTGSGSAAASADLPREGAAPAKRGVKLPPSPPMRVPLTAAPPPRRMPSLQRMFSRKGSLRSSKDLAL